jgi:hypothetical protein
MNSSQTITKISIALVKAQKEMGNAVKGSTNPFFKSKYADLNAVREAVLPVFNNNGITVIQPTCVIDGKNYVETILLHESGEFLSGVTEIISDKPNDAQKHGSGLSYARRYGLSSIAGIGAEDDDANHASSKQTITPMKLVSSRSLSKERLDNACKLIAAGDKKLYQKTIDSFDLEPSQIKQLLEAFAEPISKQLNSK